MTLYLIFSILLLLVGHAFRLLRWEQFVRIYERPQRGTMLRGMAGGYAINTILPLHLGDVFRAVFVGRRMKSGVGFALATVIMDRFLDVWFVALGFGAFVLLGQGGESARAAARYFCCSRCCWLWRWWWSSCCGTASSASAWRCAASSTIPSSWTAWFFAGA